MIKKFVPIILSLISLLIIAFFWDHIRLPYDESNNIVGNYYYNKFNPLNEILRFILFIGLPTIIYFYFYLRLNKNLLSFNVNNVNFFLKKNNDKKKDFLKKYYYFFIFFILIEFISFEFSYHINYLDLFHSGTFLVPPLNYLVGKDILKTTLYDYGLIANNLALIYNFIFGYFNPGSIIFIFLLLIFFIKLLLIKILKKLFDFLHFKKEIKIVFYCLISFIAINLPNYYNYSDYFDPRIFLYLLFVYFLGSQLVKDKQFNLNYFFVGLYSLISVLWWFDIGAFVNGIIILLILYFIFCKEYKNLALVIFSILFIWFLFINKLSETNIDEFFFQIKLVYSNSYEYLLGIEYKKPFSDNSTRWTKALLLIYFSSIMLINLNFNQKLKEDGRLKIFLNLFFISGILIFKSALMRSDASHIRYTSGIYTLVFLFLIFFIIFNFIQKKNKLNKLFNINNFIIKFNIFCFFIIILFFQGVFDNKDINTKNNKFLNIINFKKNILTLLKAKDEQFLTATDNEVLERYRVLSKNDNCIQILSDDVAFPYLLRKKSCTKFYIPAIIVNKEIEKKFIDELKLSAPEIILFESKNKILVNKKNMPDIIDYVKKNYSFFENYKEYIFYKKINL